MSALRGFKQFASISRQALAMRNVQRNISVSALARPQRTLVNANAARAFSASAMRAGAGTTDIALTQKLSEEIQFESESAAVTQDPEFIKEFKAKSPWKIEDVAGHDEITLARQFGNENIRMMFSIADIDTQQAYPNEEEEGAPAEENEEQAVSYPIRVSISITKTDAAGVINVDAICQDGAFLVDNISFYTDTKVGTELTAEADWKRRGLYIGPHFDQLDPAVQEAFEKYFEERGIDESLAMFIPEFAEHKEQLEYVQWLKNVQAFIGK